MSSITADRDLVLAVEDALKRRGVLSKMKAQMRAEVFHSLEDKSATYPSKPPDVFIAAELIKEFLMLLKLDNTLSVFCEEMGQPNEMTVDRNFLGLELGLNTLGTDPKMPLLLSIIQYLKKDRAEFLKQVGQSVEVEAGDFEDDIPSSTLQLDSPRQEDGENDSLENNNHENHDEE